MKSCLIIGGGVVGLSLAYELSRRNRSVTVIDQGPLGQEASWAGAGILPPANAATALHPLDQLRALSNQLRPQWAERLLAETGIDNGFRRCGSLHLARTPGEAAALAALDRSLAEQQIRCRRLTSAEVSQLEPALNQRDLRAAFEIPDECQLRNPRHLKALAAACCQAGVKIHEHCQAIELLHAGGRATAVRTSQGDLTADAVVLTAGAWTQAMLAREQIRSGIFPMRGQMVLFRRERPPFRRVINEGPRYLVPRDDGYVLAGSTEEEAGFDKSTTREAIADLTQFAIDLVPALREATIERTWAGLRPASFDSFPYIGRMPGVENVFVASGHFRSGLHLSPGTAVVLADLIEGQQPTIDLTPFRISRG
jgi:glycine oxidase